jgi:signal transduction histidine kinase
MHYATNLAQTHSTAFSLVEFGTHQVMDPVVYHETCRIAREAILNAFQHARASRIEVKLTFHSDRLCLIVRDDGAGMEPKTMKSGKPGHWGLPGMRERAQKIGGDINIRSRPGSGS